MKIISVETYFNKELQTGPLKKAINFYISREERHYNFETPCILAYFQLFLQT